MKTLFLPFLPFSAAVHGRKRAKWPRRGGIFCRHAKGYSGGIKSAAFTPRSNSSTASRQIYFLPESHPGHRRMSYVIRRGAGSAGSFSGPLLDTLLRRGRQPMDDGL